MKMGLQALIDISDDRGLGTVYLAYLAVDGCPRATSGTIMELRERMQVVDHATEEDYELPEA